MEGLSYNFSYDLVSYETGADTTLLGHYLSYAATDTMTVNLRYEHGNINSGGGATNTDGIQDISVGIDYKMWENVISRVEYIKSDDDTSDSESLVFNVIYSF